jgi:hypothetical protein
LVQLPAGISVSLPATLVIDSPESRWLVHDPQLRFRDRAPRTWMQGPVNVGVGPALGGGSTPPKRPLETSS